MTNAHGAARRAALVLAGFVCAVAQAQIAVVPDQVIDQLNSDQITWMDGSGQTRTVVLAHDATGFNFGAGTVYGGAIRSYTYPFNGGSRTATVTTYGNGGYAGFGYVTEHSAAGSCVGDDSPLGWQFPISGFQRVFVGRHHVILRVTQDYHRNCPTQTRLIPVTMDWVFSTGRDNPIYAITYDVTPIGADILSDDSRAPYGELNIDGDGFTYNIDGVAWGDKYKFMTTAAANVDLTSGWTYNTANTVPFVKEWINDKGAASGNATMGLVETQTFLQQDAGGAREDWAGNIRSLWNTTSAAHDGCPGSYVMPCPDYWAYQANGDSLYGGPNNNARLTWKTMYGFVGQTTYSSRNVDSADGEGAQLPGYPKKSYSVYVVLGPHTSSPVEAQIGQVETVQNLSLSATIGSVVTSGPAGVADSTSVTYAPAGYNHIYGALAFNANSNQLDANINVGAGTLTKPLIVIGNYTGGNPTVVLGGTTLAADTDYYASTRTSPNELWLTLNRNLTGATNHLQINPTTGVPSVPTGVVATGGGAVVNVSWNAVAGAQHYEIDRCLSGSDCRPAGAGWANLTTTWTGTTFGDVPGSSAIAYRIRASNTFGVSGNSIPDVAISMSFTDDPLAGGTTLIQATHLAELRSAVDLVRTLVPGLPAGTYTDAATAGTFIRALHISELRTQLDQALGPLGIPTGGYTDATLNNTVAIKAVHFEELRDRMR